MSVCTCARPRPQPITNVAIIDLLPGGFEVVGSSLQPGVSTISGVDYVDLREDRAVFFATVSEQRARDQLSNQIVQSRRIHVPPIFAESMYERNVKGPRRSGWKDQCRFGMREGRLRIHASIRLRLSLAALTLCCNLAALPKTAIARWASHFRNVFAIDNGKVLARHAHVRSEISHLDCRCANISPASDRCDACNLKTNIIGIIPELIRSH